MIESTINLIAISLGLASIFIPADPRLGLLKYSVLSVLGEFICGSLVFMALWQTDFIFVSHHSSLISDKRWAA